MTISKAGITRFFFLIPYLTMLIAGLALPSDGNHGLFTVKSLSFLGSIFCLILYFVARQQATMKQLRMLGAFILSLSFLLLWLFLGAAQEIENWGSIFDQFKIFVLTISVVVMTSYLVSEELIAPQTVMRTVIFSNFCYSLAKMFLVFLHVIKVVDMWKVVDRLGIRFMSMEMGAGLSRFQTSADIITPFLIFFVLQSEPLGLHFSKRFRAFYVVISLISIVFSFSRFLLGVAFMSIVLYALTLKISRLLKVAILFGVLAVGVVFAIGVETVGEIIYRRFFSVDNYLSDLTRKQQIDALMTQFYENPYIGLGLGGYVKDMIRDGGIVHSYEVQWVAFLMQFGLIGMAILLIPIGVISSQFVLKSSFSRIHWAFFGMFLIWLLSGFTNPFLISLLSGIVYTMFILAADILNANQLSKSSN